MYSVCMKRGMCVCVLCVKSPTTTEVAIEDASSIDALYRSISRLSIDIATVDRSRLSIDSIDRRSSDDDE